MFIHSCPVLRSTVCLWRLYVLEALYLVKLTLLVHVLYIAYRFRLQEYNSDKDMIKKTAF